MKKRNPFVKGSVYLIKKVRLLIYRVIDFFLRPLLQFVYRKKVEKVLGKILFLSRLDFGTFLIHLHYAARHEKVCIVILTPHFRIVENLAQNLCPEADIISVPFRPLIAFLSFWFGIVNVQSVTFARIFNALFKKEYAAVYYPAHQRNESCGRR